MPDSRPSLAPWLVAGLVTLAGVGAGALAVAGGDPLPWKPALLPMLWSLPGAVVAGVRGLRLLGSSMLAVAALFAGSGLASAWVEHGSGAPWLDAFAVWYVDRLSAVIVPVTTLALLLLPDGRLPSPRWRGPVVLLVGAQTLLVAVWALVRGPAAEPEATWPGTEARLGNPVGVLPGSWAETVAGLDWALQLPLLLAVVAIAVRVRRVDTDERRRLVALLLGLVIFTAVVLAGRAVWPPVADVADVLASAFLAAVLVGAVLRRHVDDVVQVVQHTVVLVVLGVGVAAVYVMAVGVLAAAGPDLSRFGAGVVAAAAALAVQPLRTRVQRGVDRLLYGDRRDPFTAVTRLAEHAHRAPSVTDVLEAVARSVATSTRAAGVRAEAFGTSAQVGDVTSTPRAVRVALVAGDDDIGSVSVVPQSGRRLRADEVRLLHELGRHAGLAVDSVRLAEEVAEHHRVVVAAREEERRRLGRELHDDLGPTVAGLSMQLGALRPMVRTDPGAVVARLARLEETAAGALADIRRVAQHLRPPVLDQVGLGRAVRQVADSLGLTVVDEVVEHGPLPAVVELAAYRIAAEALTNVARHAGASVVTLAVRETGGALLVVVADGGHGFPGGAGRASGWTRCGSERRSSAAPSACETGTTAEPWSRPCSHWRRRLRPPYRKGSGDVRVLLVDDHPLFRDGLRFTLATATDIGQVDEAGDGEEAVRLASASSYDVVVMDLRMPRMDGIEATRAVVATGAKVLVLTMFEDDATVLSAVRAGASGYLVKGADAEQVVSAVCAVADGHAVFGPSLASRVLQTFGVPGPPATAGRTDVPELSAREQEVLELLAEGLTNNEIGARLFISPVTVRNHVSRILTKLHVRDRREAMLRVRTDRHGPPAPPVAGS